MKNPFLHSIFTWRSGQNGFKIGFSLALVTVIAVNLCVAIVYIFNKHLDSDEFQHMHIVWNMFYNHEVIYRDFWEHHGVIYPALNWVWFKVFHLGADFSSYYFLRGISFCYTLIILFLTYHISKVTFKSRLGALLAVAILSSCIIFQLKSTEIRPDALQNVFWLGGLYLVLANIGALRSNIFFIVGILFGLAMETNAKAVLGIACVFVFLGSEFLCIQEKKKEQFIRIIKIVSGIATVHGIVLLCFLSVGGVYAYYRSNYIFNFNLLDAGGAEWVFRVWARDILFYQLPFLLASILGSFFLIKNVLKERKKEQIVFLLATIGCTSGALIGFYSHFWLIFLPLLAIVSAYAIKELSTYIAKIKISRKSLGSLFLCCFFIPMETFLFTDLHLRMQDEEWQKPINIAYMKSGLLQEQINTTNLMLHATKREEPVGLFWNMCGGYSFNTDVNYYWAGHTLHNNTYNLLSGYEVYGAAYVALLKEKNVRYLTVDPGAFVDFPAVTRQYIEDNYYFISRCILERTY